LWFSPPPLKSSQTVLAQLCQSEVQHGDRPQARRQLASSNRRRGAQTLSRSFLSKRNALVWARQTEAEVDRRGLTPDLKVLHQTRLVDVLTRYRDTVIALKRCRAVETIMVNAIMRQPFATLPLAALTSEKIAQYRDLRLTRVKPGTVNRDLQIVQHALDLAFREWGVPLSENPVKRVRRPPNGPGRDRRLRVGEYDRLMAGLAKCRNRHIAPLVHLAIETGMRRGEFLRIRWDDVDVTARTLRIPLTKNGHPRTVPIARAAVEIIDALRPSTGYCNTTRVFPLTAEAVKLSWRRTITRAGLADLHFHDLRHEAISRFFERGLNVPEVALISGHRDARMLFRYTHPNPETVAAKLAEFERSMIRERVHAGLKRAVARGKTLGRRPVEDDSDGAAKAKKARKLLAAGMGINRVA
jgi:integrase